MTAGITMHFQDIDASASPEVQENENWESIDFAAVYSIMQETSNGGTTWGYRGGRWGGFSVSAGTLTLTNAATNYQVVARATGVISTSTTSANWDNVLSYARVYKVTMAGGVVTAVEDHRAGPNGIFGSITGAAAELRGLTFTSDTDSTADSDPGAGLFKWNNATQSSATVLYFDNQTADGVSLTTLWGSLGTVGFITLQQGDDSSRWQEWKWTAVPVDGTGYRKFTVTLQAASASAIQDNKLVLVDFETSLPGAVVGPSSATDTAIALFDGTTGKLLKNSVVTISDLGAVAGATSLTIAQGTITDPANALTVTSTWNDAADTFIGASIDITDTASAAASLLQRWRVGGSQMASISKAGVATFVGGASLGGALTAALFQLTGTISTGIDALMIVNATHASTITSTQYGIDFAPRFSIPGGAVTTIYGIRFNPRVDATANNVTNFYAASLQLIKSAGHTGTITNGANFRSETPSLGGGNPITTFTQFLGETNSTNGSGITSGSVTNRGLHIAAISVAAGVGGTVTNIAGSLTVPSGSAAGNTNYGLRITGNGGGASTNWAMYSDSTAGSAIAGNVRIGSTTAPTVALDVTGSAAISTNLNVTGVSGLGAASSSTTAVIVPASVAGVSSLRIPHGTAPSSPVNGDVWTTTAGIFVRINGATVGPLS